MGNCKVTAGHGVLPGGLAVHGLAGAGAVTEQQLDAVEVANERCDVEGVAEEGGVEISFGDFATGWGVGLEAVAEEDFKAVLGVVVQGFFVGRVGAVGEEKLGQFAPAGVGRFVRRACGATAKDTGEGGEEAAGLVKALVRVALESERVGIGAAFEQEFGYFEG